MEWVTDTAANIFKNSYFDDINETGTTLDISGNLKVRGDIRVRGVPPIGGITIWSGTLNGDGTIPDYENWQICDGTNNTPDLRGRFILGSTNNTSLDVTGEGQVSYSEGDTGGSETVTLTESEMPSHTHAVGSDGYHNHGVVNYNANDFNWSNHYTVGNDDSGNERSWYTSSSGSHSHNNYSQYGGSGSHENRPPYYVLAFIMRMY